MRHILKIALSVFENMRTAKQIKKGAVAIR